MKSYSIRFHSLETCMEAFDVLRFERICGNIKEYPNLDVSKNKITVTSEYYVDTLRKFLSDKNNWYEIGS